MTTPHQRLSHVRKYARGATSTAFAALRETMERCSKIVADAYDVPLESLHIYEGDLPPGHRSGDRRQRYMVVEQNGDLVVALPGTTHPMDWSSNLRVGYQPIDGCLDVPPAALETVPCAHAGFYYRSETVPTLTLLHDAAARGCRLVLTGHSLGGAVANLCALTALRAQRAARAAAAAAAAARHASALHSVTDNHSACSANSDVAISPDAALVEVLCISFASPIFANATLVKHIEACGWEECFVNIIVPEDYCLKLFNNVLTSAQPDSGCISRSSSFSRGSVNSCHGPSAPLRCVMQQAVEYAEDSMDEHTADCSPCSSSVTSSSIASGMDDVSHCAVVANTGKSDPALAGLKAPYTYSSTQQPMASALLNKCTRTNRATRRLSFARPAEESILDEYNGASAGARRSSTALNHLLPTGTPPEVVSSLPCCVGSSSSSSSSSINSLAPSWVTRQSRLHEEDNSSLSSTRSWTLLAYLPGLPGLARSFSSASITSWSFSSDTDCVSASPTISATAEAASEHFASWGLRHARNSCASFGISATVASDASDELDDLIVPFVGASVMGQPYSSRNGDADVAVLLSVSQPCQQHAAVEQQCEQQQKEGDESERAGMWQPKQQNVQLQLSNTEQQTNLYRSTSLASLAAINRSATLLVPHASAAVRVPAGLLLITSLLPSVRGIVRAGRSVASAASTIGSAALGAPLDALELGLVLALKPPMYHPAGQQWVLSATGLVPQQQPIHAYPRNVHDVFWHRDLLLVAFREHSIAFYKQRLLTQAARR